MHTRTRNAKRLLKRYAPRCGRVRGNGKVCRNFPGHETDHRGVGPCYAHANRYEHRVWTMSLDIAREEQITPWEALLRGVRLAANRVTWADAQLAHAVRMNDGDVNHPAIARWMRESREERRLMAQAAKVAIDAGVAAAIVRQVELEGQIVASAVAAALDALELTPELRMQAITAAHDHLMASNQLGEGDPGGSGSALPPAGTGPTQFS